MDGTQTSAGGDKTLSIPVVRDSRFQRFSPLAVAVSRMPAELVEKFEMRLQSPVQREVSHRFGTQPTGEVGMIGRDVALEVIEHAVVELTPRQLARLRDDIARVLGAAPTSEEVSRDRLSQLAGLIVAAETALSQLASQGASFTASRARESGGGGPDKAELAMLNARVELLVSAMARIEALVAHGGPRAEPADTGRAIAGPSAHAALFEASRASNRAAPAAAPVEMPPPPRRDGRAGPAILAVSLLVVAAGVVAWWSFAPLGDSAARALRLTGTQAAPSPALPGETAASGPRAAVPNTGPLASAEPPAPAISPAPSPPPPVVATAPAAPPPAPDSQVAPSQVAASQVAASGAAPVPATRDAGLKPDSDTHGAAVPPANAAAASAAPLSHQAVLARAESWIRVRDGRGTTYIERTLKPGESWPVPALPGLILTTGNAGGTVLVTDGVASPPLGAVGATRSGVQLGSSQ